MAILASFKETLGELVLKSRKASLCLEKDLFPDGYPGYGLSENDHLKRFDLLRVSN